MSKYAFKWTGTLGFIDTNVSAYKLRGGDVTVNGEELNPRTTYLPDDIVVVDSEVLANMMRGNGNWVEVPVPKRQRKIKDNKDNVNVKRNVKGGK